jgi:hypothetical protein
LNRGGISHAGPEPSIIRVSTTPSPGVTFSPGEFVYADDNGVIVFAQAQDVNWRGCKLIGRLARSRGFR